MIADRRRSELVERTPVELLPDDGRELDERALVGAQAIDTRSQQRLDRRWNLDRLDVDGDAASRRPSARRTRSSTSIRTSSRTNNGLPSVDAGIFASSSTGSSSASSRFSASRAVDVLVETFERDHGRGTAAFDERRP